MSMTRIRARAVEVNEGKPLSEANTVTSYTNCVPLSKSNSTKLDIKPVSGWIENSLLLEEYIT